MLTFGLQVDVLIRARLSIVHELPHDDGKAVDVSFGRPIDLKTEMSQKLGGCPVNLYKKQIPLHVLPPFYDVLNAVKNVKYDY